MVIPHVVPAPTEITDQPLTSFYSVGSALKGVAKGIRAGGHTGVVK